MRKKKTKALAKPRTTIHDATEITLQVLADEGTQKWQDTYDAIIAFGQFLIEARIAAGHGNFGRLFKGHAKPVERPIPITQHTGEQLMKIAKDPVLSNSTYRSSLPPHWKTLILLTQFSEEEKVRLIGEGKISAELTQDQAHALLYYRTATTPAEQAVITRRLKAYQKRLKRRSTEGCLCECRCGDVHPDKRLISGPRSPDPSPKPEGKGKSTT